MGDNLDALVNQLQKKYGSGSVISLKSGKFPTVDRVPISSPNLMSVFGGGLPRGRIMELYGNESSGKTSLACYFAGQVQEHDFGNRKGRVAFVDAEHALDFEYAKTFGFDVTKTLFSQPDSGEQASDIIIDLVNSKEFDLIIVDSVAAMTPIEELEGSSSDNQISPLARLMGKHIRKVTAAISNTRTTILYLNQQRDKPGCVTPDCKIVIDY